MADATTASLATALLGLNRKRDPLEIYNSFAKQQLAAGTSTAPLGSGNPLEGIARALQGGLGGLIQGYAANKEEQRGKDTVTTLGDLYNAPDDATRAKIIQNTKGDTDIIAPIVAQLLGNKQMQQAAGATIKPLGVDGGSGGALGTPVAPPMQQGGGAGPSIDTTSLAPPGDAQSGFANNSGNIRSTAPGNFNGFATYQTPQAGATAHFQNYQAYAQQNPNITVAQALAKWSPPTENDTQGIIRQISEATGINPGMPLADVLKDPAMAAQLLDAQTRREKGGLPRGFNADTFMAAAGGPQGSPGQAAPGQNVGPIASPPPAQGSGPTPAPQPGPPTARSSPAGDQLRQTAQAFAQAGNMVEAEKYGKAAVEADAKWSALVGEKNVDQSYEDVKHQRSVADEAARHQRDLQDKKDNPTYTQEQNLAHTYATRLNNAIPQLEALVKDPSKIPSWNEQLQANSPYYPEPLVSDKAKEFRRVTKDIMSSTLRRESGASIHNDEYATEAQKFIPQPGDPPEVVANKLAALKQAGRSIAEGTGRPVTTYGVFGAQPPAGSGAAGPAQGGGGIPAPPPGFRPIR